MKYIQLVDDSVVDQNLELVFVSNKLFKASLIRRNCCFYCFKTHKEYTKEHIIPRWILRKFNLWNSEIRLPNGELHTYKNYTVNCCDKCNGFLNREFEMPMSNMFDKGASGLIEYVNNYGDEKIYLWLCLIFVKTHFKDDVLSMSQDRRVEHAYISDAMEYDFSMLHHIFCLARSPYSSTKIDDFCIGSMWSMDLEKDAIQGGFEYIDLIYAHTIGVVVGNVGIVVVIGDCGAVKVGMSSRIQEITTKTFGMLQFLEFVMHVATCYLHLKDTPTFHTSFQGTFPKICCSLEKPEPEYFKYDPLVYGTLMREHILPRLSKDVLTDEFVEKLSAGRGSWLFSD